LKAEVTVDVNEAPTGGYLTMDPSTGVELQTSFWFNAFDWTDVEKDYPLTYKFSFVSGGKVYMASLDSTIDDLKTILPKPSTDLSIHVEVKDALGAMAIGQLTIDLGNITSQANTQLNSTLQSIFSSGLSTISQDDTIKAPAVVSALSLGILQTSGSILSEDESNELILKLLQEIEAFVTEFGDWSGGTSAAASMINSVMKSEAKISDDNMGKIVTMIQSLTKNDRQRGDPLTKEAATNMIEGLTKAIAKMSDPLEFLENAESIFQNIAEQVLTGKIPGERVEIKTANCNASFVRQIPKWGTVEV
jgi:hypothetical protein